MILKKEHISNGKLSCYISMNNKLSKLIINNKVQEIDLSSIKEIEACDEYDLMYNYLLRINKLLSNLKHQDESFLNSEIRIIVDNKAVERIIKPEGFIIQKPSKDFKKSVNNQRLKAMLGITLQELSNFKNIDLEFEHFLQKEEVNMNNINEFDYKKEDDNFELDMDISGLNDMMNVSEMNSLNYDENDLFKEFDLNTENLFTENNPTEFILEEDIISIPDYETKKDTEIFSRNLENAASTHKETYKDEDSFEFIYTSDDLEKDIIVKDSIDLINSDNFKLDDDFILGDNIEKENFSFIFEDDVKEDKNIEKDTNTQVEEDLVYPTEETLTYSATEEVTYPIKEETVYPVTEESTHHTEEVLNYPIEEDLVYPTEETLTYSVTEESTHPIKEETVYPVTEETTYHTEEVLNYPIEEDLVCPVVEIKELNIKHDNKTSTKQEAISTEDTSISNTSTEIYKKEDTLMNKNNIDSHKTLDIHNDFIQNELMELKNILKEKATSYKEKLHHMNSQYEEKHMALKDLNLTNEDEQIKIFKEFLTCKSNMISLKALDETCMSIISEIDNKIFNIKNNSK